jgi:hypothetical protein
MVEKRQKKRGIAFREKPIFMFEREKHTNLLSNRALHLVMAFFLANDRDEMMFK